MAMRVKMFSEPALAIITVEQLPKHGLLWLAVGTFVLGMTGHVCDHCNRQREQHWLVKPKDWQIPMVPQALCQKCRGVIYVRV